MPIADKTGTLDLGDTAVRSSHAPSDDADLANKAYVDAAAAGGALTEITVITAWKYDSSARKFYVKTRTAKVVEPSAESGWTEAVGNVAQCEGS
jgi:hypothetical protein